MCSLFLRRSFLYFMTPRRPAFPGPPAPRATAVEMEQEKVNGSKELSADATSYRCSACHGDEDWALGHPIRGRAKSRSLSASPALASTREFRYKASSGPRRRSLRHPGGGHSLPEGSSLKATSRPPEGTPPCSLPSSLTLVPTLTLGVRSGGGTCSAVSWFAQ